MAEQVVGVVVANVPGSPHEAGDRPTSVVEEMRQSEPQLVAVLLINEGQPLKALDTPASSFVEHLLAMPQDNGEFERIEVELRDSEL